jgi:hypothetical protein
MTFIARLATGFGYAVVLLNDRQFLSNIFLLPLRDLIAPFTWAASFMGSRIHWRGTDFNLKDGRLTMVKPDAG